MWRQRTVHSRDAFTVLAAPKVGLAMIGVSRQSGNALRHANNFALGTQNGRPQNRLDNAAAVNGSYRCQ